MFYVFLRSGPIPADIAAKGLFAVTSAIVLESNQRTGMANKMLSRRAEHDLTSKLLQGVDAEVAAYLANVAKKRAQIASAVQAVEALKGLWVHVAGEIRAGFSERAAAGQAELLELKHDLHRMASAWVDMFYVRFVFPAKTSTVRHRKFVEDAERDLEMAMISLIPGLHSAGQAEQEVLERKRAALKAATAMHDEIVAKRDTLLESTNYRALSTELECEDKTVKAEEQFGQFVDDFTRKLYPQQQPPEQEDAAAPDAKPLRRFSTHDLDDGQYTSPRASPRKTGPPKQAVPVPVATSTPDPSPGAGKTPGTLAAKYALSGEDAAVYASLWGKSGKSDDGFLPAGVAYAFLGTSGLPKDALAEIWKLSANDNKLSEDGFYAACKLVAASQNGLAINLKDCGRATFLPFFGDGAAARLCLSPAEVANYDALWAKAGSANDTLSGKAGQNSQTPPYPYPPTHTPPPPPSSTPPKCGVNSFARALGPESD